MDIQTIYTSQEKIETISSNDALTPPTITFTPSNFPKMDGQNPSDSDKLKIDYSAKLPAQITEVSGETIANVVFVVGWDS